MRQPTKRQATIQDHHAYLDGTHDFQVDIETLASSELVGTILETVMLATEVRFAAVARVTSDRWVACRTVDEVNFGLAPGDEIEIGSTFCQSVRQTSQKVMFSDVATDETYRDDPIAAKFGIVSYASIPIFRSDGTFFGTLCAIDTVPRDMKHPRAVAMLEMFAEIIGQGLETQERLEAQEQQIRHEREMARVQEELVAVLGHDLRNPVAAIEAGVRHLEKEDLSERGRTILPLMRASLLRANDLIENIMLHAKSRLGGGIRVCVVSNAPLAEAIEQVVEEVRAATPDHDIELALSLGEPVSCDALRVAQAVSNLLSNAIRHSEEGSPVSVRGEICGDAVEISVANRGTAITNSTRANLFKPFHRGTDATGEGLGLGLHIASSIATAHNGRIEVSCKDGTTCFTFKLPVLMT
ncbi:GAF domain-containing sensor histidine kinase [Roseivivax sp. CAU 1761]